MKSEDGILTGVEVEKGWRPEHSGMRRECVRKEGTSLAVQSMQLSEYRVAYSHSFATLAIAQNRGTSYSPRLPAFGRYHGSRFSRSPRYQT